MQSFIKIGAVRFELSCEQTDKRRAKYNLLAEVKSHILPCSVSEIRQNIQFVSTIGKTTFQQHMHKMAIKL